MRTNLLSALTILILAVTLMTSCENEKCIKEVRSDYAFFAAGHAYSLPWVENDGFYVPFSENITYLNNYPNLNLGVFTGDVVFCDSEESWDEYLIAKESIDMDTYVVPGNHDYKNPELFESYFGNPNHFFNHGTDLFICLEVNTTGWNIRDHSLSILNEALESINHPTQNVFIFVHQLIWFEEDSKYSQCNPNSLEGREDISNFNSDILPILENIDNQVVIYAGDIGALRNDCSVMYDQFNNIQLVASGMGSGQNDNVVITKVDSVGRITFDLIALNGEDKSAMGNIVDYWVE